MSHMEGGAAGHRAGSRWESKEMAAGGCGCSGPPKSRVLSPCPECLSISLRSNQLTADSLKVMGRGYYKKYLKAVLSKRPQKGR